MSQASLLGSAELALGSYANLDAGLLNTASQRASLVTTGMSEAQVGKFVERYPEVLTQFRDTNTSFSATVFKDTSGNLTLAIRGTLEAGDFVPTDVNIALHGAGYDQIVAMHNWWVKATSPNGQLVQQYRIASPSAPFLLEAASSGLGTAKLIEAFASDPDHRVEITGHSLGAHLVLAFNTLFRDFVSEVVGFNTAGFINNLGNQLFFATLGGSVPIAANSGNVTNVIADESGTGATPWNAIAGLHSPPGTTVNISIEDQWLSDEPNPAGSSNHSLTILTDSLAVFNLLNQLDPALNTTDYKTILNQAALGTSASYERVVDALEALFGINRALQPTGNINRDALYGAIYGLQSNSVFASVAGRVRISPFGTGLSVAQIAAIAGTPTEDNVDRAFRYALKELNPFAIVGNNAIYSSHNKNAELDLYDPASGVGMTSQYLADRSEMLRWKNLDYAADGQRVLRSTRTETYQYTDKTLKDAFGNDLALTVTGRQLGSVSNPAKIIFGGEAPESLLGSDLAVGDHLYGGAGDDVLDGQNGNDYLEGGAGADTLLAGEGDDVLLGGAGDDTLAGGAGSDVLDGGIGFDTYRYFSGDGPDTIADADGRGQIFYDGVLLTGGSSFGLDLWRSEDERFQFMLYAEDDGTQTLSVSGSGTLFIKDFSPGTLGITLEDAPPPTLTPPAGGREILGIYAPQIFDSPPDLNNLPPGYQYLPISSTPYPYDYVLRDDLANLVRDPLRPWTGGHQDLFGSNGGDEILGSDFGNGMAGYAGDDYLQGGRSPDGAGGGEGDDFIEGGAFFDAPLEDWLNVSAAFPEGKIQGASDDRLFGGAGDDVIFGSTAADLEGLLDPATPSAGHKGDWVAGEMGDDRLYGSSGHDVLLGGGGEDRLIGGPGDDVLVGDDSFATSHTTNPAAGGWMWRIDGGSSPSDLQFFPISVMPWLDWSESYYKRAGDDDVLFGGAGDDVLLGQLGNDMLFGEIGNDVLAGWEGDDTLLGGEGNDVIAGDFGRYEQANDRLVGLTHSVPAGFLDSNTGDSGEPEQSGSDYLDGGSGDDILYGEGGTDTVLGGGGNDTLWGDAGYLPEDLHGADYLDGGSGDDTLHGGSGDDTLVGGIGDDTLDGGEGSDTYIFGKGDGADYIEDSGWQGSDILVLRDHLQSEVSIDRGVDGRLTITGAAGDAVTVQSFAGNEDSGIERIQFSDGTTLDREALRGLPVALNSIVGQDWNNASDADDVIDTYGMATNGTGGFVLLDAGAGNDVVSGDSNAVVYGNEGDDQLIGGNILIGGEGNDHLADGITLLGGPGNDQLYNGALLVGGPGNDFLDGGFGASRFGISLEDYGHDTIYDSEGLDEFALADWYYPTIGIPDWEDRLFDPDTEDSVSLEEGIELGLLPELTRIASHDYAALEPLYAAGIIEKDALEIGPGVTLQDIALDWETIELISPLDGDLGPYVVLNVGINPDIVASLVIPRSDDLLGAGIEEVRFGNGTAVTLDELIALAPPAPDFDPAFVPNLDPIFVFDSGDGVRFIDDPGVTTIQFGAGISADLLTLGLGSLLIRVGDQGDAIHLNNFDPNDAFSSQIQKLAFADGSELTYGELITRGFDLFGTEGDDFLSGTNAPDRLHGGAGNDFYFFELSPGGDTVEDKAGDFDTVFLGGSIAPASVAVTRADEFLTLGLNSADHIAIRWQPDAGYQIEEVRFSDGTAWDAATLESMATTAQNTAPTLANAIADQSAQEDEAFSFILPTGTFADTDPGDMLSIGATLADGTPLRAWLVFDVTTQSFNGIPTNDDLGSFDVAVTATDGGGLSVGDVFTLAVTKTNDAPSFGAAFSNQFGNQNAPFEFALSPVRRYSGHRSKEPDEEGRLELLIESWFGRARDRAIPLSAFLDGEDAGHGEHRRGGHNLPHSTQDDIAASWRRTAVLLEVHLSSHDLAASDHREGAGASTLFGGHGLVPERMGDRLARTSGHDLQRFGGLAEGFSKLKG